LIQQCLFELAIDTFQDTAPACKATIGQSTLLKHFVFLKKINENCQ